MSSIFTKPVLFIDTREQKPLKFDAYKERFDGIVRTTLKAGDYTIHGKDGQIAFERKSIQDLVQTLTKGRDRFIRELEILKDYSYAAILIEASFDEVSRPYRFSRAAPKSIIGSLQMIQVRYDIDVIFSGNRANSEEVVIKKIEAYYGKA